jgi:dTDP-4-dehydrorhamnose reductase
VRWPLSKNAEALGEDINMRKDKERVLVLGASGMLGNAVYRHFSASESYETYGSIRSSLSVKYFSESFRGNLISGVDVENTDGLAKVFSKTRPDYVINCIGLVKQLSEIEDPLVAIPINSLLPHRLARLSEISSARLVHFSTDCVFSGAVGGYKESDLPDAKDLYGLSKYLGEVDYPNAITLRTSIIGHELDGGRSLIGWFLSQQEKAQGYRKAIFSGLPAIEIARVIHDYVLPRKDLRGLYHLSADPINKYELLRLVATQYKKSIEVIPNDQFVIDRSLDSTRFRGETGFKPKGWVELVRAMHDFH